MCIPDIRFLVTICSTFGYKVWQMKLTETVRGRIDRKTKKAFDSKKKTLKVTESQLVRTAVGRLIGSMKPTL